MRKDVIPIKKPKKPIHAEIRWIMGLSRVVENFSPNLWRKEVKVKMKKNTIENVRETAMNTGVLAGGAVSKSAGACLGRTDKSYKGDMEGVVQFRGELLFERAQEPRIPKNKLGPSFGLLPGCALEGTTVRRAT